MTDCVQLGGSAAGVVGIPLVAAVKWWLEQEHVKWLNSPVWHLGRANRDPKGFFLSLYVVSLRLAWAPFHSVWIIKAKGLREQAPVCQHCLHHVCSCPTDQIQTRPKTSVSMGGAAPGMTVKECGSLEPPKSVCHIQLQSPLSGKHLQ